MKQPTLSQRLSPSPSHPAGLAGRAVRSGTARLAEQAVRFVLGVGTAIVLARLLTPADFGLLAMVTSFVAFVGSFKDFGLPVAAVHKAELNEDQVSRLFWLNLKLNGLLFAAVVLMGPVLAWFYGEPRLTFITAAMAIAVLGFGLGTVHRALLMREMRFDALALVDTVAALVGAAFAVGMALLGAGYWALVAQSVVTECGRSLGLLRIKRWWPRRGAAGRGADLRSIFTYSSEVTGFRVIAHVGRNLDRVLVGYFNGAVVLGLYNSAYRWSLFPLQQLYTPLVNVAVAGLSRVQHDPDRYRALARRGLLPVFATVIPVLAFMGLEARNVIHFLLGDAWLDAVPFFRLMCGAAALESINKSTKWLYLSQGQTARQLRWGIVYAVVMVAAVAVGARWGAMGVAWGFTLGTAGLTFPGLAYCLRTSPMTLQDFTGVLWRPALAVSVAMGGTMALLPVLPDLSPFFDLLLRLPLFGVLYLSVWLASPGGRTDVGYMISLLPRRHARHRTSPDKQRW